MSEQHKTDNFVRGYKFALVRNINRAELPYCDPDEHSPKHNNVYTGDPCWCGSDSCTICTICGMQNHD